MSQQDSRTNWYLTAKYGLYVTWAYEGPGTGPHRGCGCYPDGSLPQDFQPFADGFDVEAFAQDCADFGVQYVNFTGNHAHLYFLCPSRVLEERLPGHTSRRDVIRELLDALHSRGIRLQLYLHATIGDTMTEAEREALGWYDAGGGYRRWNDFVNAFFAEVAERYGDEMDSYYFDMIFDAPFLDMIDRPRLYSTLKRHAPKAVIVGNGDANEAVDYGSREDASVAVSDAMQRTAFPTQTVVLLSDWWWSTVPATAKSPVRYTPRHLYQTLVLTAAANTEGGGLAIGASPYATRGFEPGVRDTLAELGRLVRPVAESIKNTLPSTAYPVPAGATIPTLYGGVAATRSADGRCEYLHVLVPPQTAELHLPPPLDGAVFADATMLRTGHTAGLAQDETGLHLAIPDAWDALDTVIRLPVAQRPERRLQTESIPPDRLKASSPEGLEGHAAACAVDGDPDTFWLTDTGAFHSITVDIGDIREVCALRVLPRQDGTCRDQLVTHITSYALYASEDGETYRPVATGEWKRTPAEKSANFPPVRARYLKLVAGPAWLPEHLRPFPIGAGCAAEIRVDVVAR